MILVGTEFYGREDCENRELSRHTITKKIFKYS